MTAESTYNVQRVDSSWGCTFFVVDGEGEQVFKVEVWHQEPDHAWKHESEVNWQACGDRPAKMALVVADAVRQAAEYALQYDEAVNAAR